MKSLGVIGLVIALGVVLVSTDPIPQDNNVTQGSSVCGNGIVEGSEECDCIKHDDGRCQWESCQEGSCKRTEFNLLMRLEQNQDTAVGGVPTWVIVIIVVVAVIGIIGGIFCLLIYGLETFFYFLCCQCLCPKHSH